MRRNHLLALVAVFAGTLIAGLPAAQAATGTKIKLESTKKLGKILANSHGFTIYAFTKDTKNHDSCQGISGCTGVWPPVVTSGKPVAGPGVKQSLLGTIKLKNGQMQVTYNNHPLYTYTGDSGPGQTSYVNFSEFGGRWPALNAAGSYVK